MRFNRVRATESRSACAGVYCGKEMDYEISQSFVVIDGK